jgi:hypothetical protein
LLVTSTLTIYADPIPQDPVQEPDDQEKASENGARAWVDEGLSCLTNKDFFLRPHSRGLQQFVFTQTQRDKLKYNTDSSE